jgi:cysteine-rich CPCC protein
VFDRNRHLELVDGRDLVVTYEGEDFGWSAYIPGDTKRPTLAATPAAAIVAHLDFAAGEVPGWVYAFSERFVQELRDAPRHVCDCCGYRTLLNAGYNEICRVCGWEDDRADTGRIRGGPDAPSGPNRISLTQARANFAEFGAAKERSRPHVRRPRPDDSG